MLRAVRACIFLAVDALPDLGGVIDFITRTMDGPIAPNVAGIKLNDCLHIPGGGQLLVNDIATRWPDFRIFLDFKSADVLDTAVNTVRRYTDVVDPGRLLVTVSVHSAPKVFVGLPKAFPGLSIAVMGIPTDMKKPECIDRYGMTPSEAIRTWLGSLFRQMPVIDNACVFPGNAIASFDMLEMFADCFPQIGPITPGIRDEWMIKGNQERVTATRDALLAGAEFLVMGSQLTKGNKDRGVDAMRSQELTVEQLKEVFA